MHAWIFRHRKRLSAVFGMVTGEPLCAERSDEPVARSAPEDAEPKAGRLGIPPGSYARRERYVVLAPMPRRRDASDAA